MAMTAVWPYLASMVFNEEAIHPSLSKALYCVFLLFMIPSPVIYFIHDTSTLAHRESFTWLMRWGLGAPAAVFTLLLAWKIFTAQKPWGDTGFSSLALSVAVFSLGGLTGVSIEGANTIIPAHYHCAIGAVTIAFMGLFYKILPSFGKPLWSARLAAIQPYLYSLGIVLFAIGLFLAGSHGVARKAYGGAQNHDTTARFVGMSIMGAGALVAISGGIAFVLNAVFSLFGRAGAAPVRDNGPEVGG